MRDLESQARSLLKQLELLKKVFKANKQQLSSAVKRTKSEKKVYKQGRGELNFVIESQDSEQAARFQLFETGALYQALYWQLEDLRDQILNRDSMSSVSSDTDKSETSK